MQIFFIIFSQNLKDDREEEEEEEEEILYLFSSLEPTPQRGDLGGRRCEEEEDNSFSFLSQKPNT